MSLRHYLPSIPGAGVVATTNGMENDDGVGVGVGGDDGDDPSKKKKPNTLAVVVANSIWIIRTVNGHIWNFQGQFWNTMGYLVVNGTIIFRHTVATIMNTVGFLYSAGVELLLTSRSEFKNQWLPLVEELKLFLTTSGIADELERGANYRFLSNIAILARMQDVLLERGGAAGTPSHFDRRSMASLDTTRETGITTFRKPKQVLSEQLKVSIMDDGKRFNKYTTAAYGVSMIDAADIQVYGSVQTSKTYTALDALEDGNELLLTLKSSMSNSLQTKQLQHSPSFYDRDWLLGRISEHIGIPETDIYPMNLTDEKVDSLRFFVAVDHANKYVVLSIRGTLTMREVLIDVAAFSRPFCGGEAHSEMANHAEEIWERAKDLIMELLLQNEGYELIVTGHSLGGGTACLLNIMLHENNREKVNGRAIRCYAYATPPVFAGDITNGAKEACINYIHDEDVVPFLSVDSVRRTFAAVRAVDESNLSAWIRTLILWGQTEVIDESTLLRVESALHDPLPVKEGAPELLIPARVNVWMRSTAPQLPKDLTTMEELRQLQSLLPFDFILADSAKLSRMGVTFDPAMLADHFPNAYENALHNLKQ